MGYFYILRCSDGSYYCGSTRDLDARMAQHASGHGAKYTSRRLPVEFVFVQEYENIAEAYAMEKRVQNWSRAKREALINGKYNELPLLSKKRFDR